MKAKTTLPITQARTKIYKIADDIKKNDNYYTLTQNGKPVVVMISVEKFEQFIEAIG